MPALRRFSTCLLFLGPALLGLVLMSAPVSADIGGGLVITATAENGDAASFAIVAPPDVMSWSWASDQSVELRSPTTGDVLAVMNPSGSETWINVLDDPVITLGFTLQAGSAPLTLTIGSPLLSFPTITATGRATVAMTLTDSDGDGATLVGVGDPAGSHGAYLAQYNGYVTGGTTFAELIQTMAAGPWSSDVASGEVGPGGAFVPIANPVSDMSVMISFTLSAHDQASGTSTYVIVPVPVPVEPTTWSRIKLLMK